MNIKLTAKKIKFCIKQFFGGLPGLQSYSMAGEDTMMRGFMGAKKFWGGGFWVDIGAHHPSHLSNTKMYSLAGWRGINVDASSDAIALFNRQRKRDINVNVGIGKEEGVLDYYRMSSPSMNTFSKKFADEAVAKGLKVLEVVKVPVVTLKSLLDKYLPQGGGGSLSTLCPLTARGSILRFWSRTTGSGIVLNTFSSRFTRADATGRFPLLQSLAI